MNAFKAYRLYLAIKLHFTSEKYNVFQSRARVNATFAAFERRADRVMFARLARLYPREPDLIKFLAANFLYGHVPLYDVTTAATNLRKFVARREAMSYNFMSDLRYLDEMSSDKRIPLNEMIRNPVIMMNVVGTESITIETVCILHDLLDITKSWDPDDVTLIVWREEIIRIRKSTRFIRYNKGSIEKIIQQFKLN